MYVCMFGSLANFIGLPNLNNAILFPIVLFYSSGMVPCKFFKQLHMYLTGAKTY